MFGARQGYREISGGQGHTKPNLGPEAPLAVSAVHVISGFQSGLLPSESSGSSNTFMGLLFPPGWV